MINGVHWLTLFSGIEEENEQTRPDCSNVSTLLVFLWISYTSFWRGGGGGGLLPGSGAFVHVNRKYTSSEKNQYIAEARKNQY